MMIKEMKIIEPIQKTWTIAAVQNEGYKVYRPHASGLLIHAIK